MDFTLEEHQQELRGLAAELLAREASPERVEAHERGEAPYDVPAWKAMAQAGLLALAAPESLDGQDFGLLELAVLLEEAGRRAAPVPVMSCLVLGVLPLTRWGTPEQQRDLLPAVTEGETLLTAAVHEPGRPHVSAAELATTARRDGAGFVLDGAKTRVPYAGSAARVLVPARVGETGGGVFLVDPATEGVTLTTGYTAHGHPESGLNLHGVRVGAGALLGGSSSEDGSSVRWLADHAVAASCALAGGVLSEALRLTTEHVGTREQFGRPIGAFQGAALQVADVYIEARALEAATWSACWRLATGREHGAALAVAAHRLTSGAVTALHTCQHLHGGLGLDVTYPLHRYFAWTKHLAQACGGADHQLDRLVGALAS